MKDTDTIPVLIPITVERIKDLLCSAIEGGSNYWVQTLDREGGIDRKIAPYRQDVPFEDGGWLDLRTVEEDGKIYQINLDTITKGMAVFANKYPHHFADFFDGNDDAETGDAFLQCICFGDIIYA